jgi:hypothetical protein
VSLNNLPRIHERESLVQQAELIMRQSVLDACKDLTEGERLRAVTSVFSSTLQSQAKYMIREERHPGKPDIPGGLEA